MPKRYLVSYRYRTFEEREGYGQIDVEIKGNQTPMEFSKEIAKNFGFESVVILNIIKLDEKGYIQ